MFKINEIFDLTSKINSLKKTENDENAKSILDGIQELLTRIKDCKSYQDLIEEINKYLKYNKSAKYIENNIIKIEDYYLITGLESNEKYYKQVYPSLSEKGIKMIPEYITSAKTPEGFSVTALRIADTKRDGLLDFESNYAILTDKQKQEAYQEIKTLLKLGIVNPEIQQNSLKITADKEHRIICINWENLEAIESYYKKFGNNAEQILAAQYYTKIFR